MKGAPNSALDHNVNHHKQRPNTPVGPNEPTPFEPAHSMVFLSGEEFNPHEPSAVFGMITGVRTYVPGIKNCIEIRRILTRGARMVEQFDEFLSDRKRGSLTPNSECLGCGWAFRDKGGWGRAYYFTQCVVVSSHEEMTGALPVVEDVMILNYEEKIDITERIRTQLVTVS